MHKFTTRVYYEDTDMAGVVYYANYLKFIERARSTWIEELGIDQKALKAEGLVFVVRRLTADYLGAAHYGDHLLVKSAIAKFSRVEIQFDQQVFEGETCLFKALVSVVAMNENGRPTRLPAALTENLQQKIA